MSGEPQIEQRAEQPYAGIRLRVTMDGLPGEVDRGFPELFGWLAERGVAPAGPPFIRYHVIDMDRELDVELGVPAGRYAVLRHTGPYDGLIASNAALQRWAGAHEVALDSWDAPGGTAWRGRVEHYLTNPAAEPDPAKWEVDVAYLTTDG
jgi:hypothetical protein